MVDRIVTVGLDEGLHVRPIAMIVEVVNESPCSVHISFGEKRVEASSQLNLMLLAAPKGSELTLSAEGDEAEVVLDRLENLFQTNFKVEGKADSE